MEMMDIEDMAEMMEIEDTVEMMDTEDKVCSTSFQSISFQYNSRRASTPTTRNARFWTRSTTRIQFSIFKLYWSAESSFDWDQLHWTGRRTSRLHQRCPQCIQLSYQHTRIQKG